MRVLRRIGFTLGAAAVLLAAYLDATGHHQAKLGLLITAGVAGGPALLHALFVGLPAAERRQPAPAPVPVSPAPPARAVPAPRPAVAPAIAARAARGGLPPSPTRRQLTR
jgi:hypothetical protein